METLYQILALVGAGLIVWVLYRFMKTKPESLSRENLSKSFSTMGILALILIVLVVLLIYTVRST